MAGSFKPSDIDFQEEFSSAWYDVLWRIHLSFFESISPVLSLNVSLPLTATAQLDFVMWWYHRLRQQWSPYLIREISRASQQSYLYLFHVMWRHVAKKVFRITISRYTRIPHTHNHPHTRLTYILYLFFDLRIFLVHSLFVSTKVGKEHFSTANGRNSGSMQKLIMGEVGVCLGGGVVCPDTPTWTESQTDGHLGLPFRNYSGADPEFPVGGGANPPWEGAKIQIFPKTAWNKNAFQWDAYRPLVDRMLESASRGLLPGGCLPGPGGFCLVRGGGSAWSGGVLHGPGGVCLVQGGGGSAWSGGGSAWSQGGLVSQHALRQTPQPGVKILPWPQLRCGR